MSTGSITRTSSAALSEDIRRAADNGPVIADEYLVIRRDSFRALSDSIIDEFDRELAARAWGRRECFEEGPTLEEMQKKHGL